MGLHKYLYGSNRTAWTAVLGCDHGMIRRSLAQSPCAAPAALLIQYTGLLGLRASAVADKNVHHRPVQSTRWQHERYNTQRPRLTATWAGCSNSSITAAAAAAAVVTDLQLPHVTSVRSGHVLTCSNAAHSIRSRRSEACRNSLKFVHSV